jgi:hypothetical protein
MTWVAMVRETISCVDTGVCLPSGTMDVRLGSHTASFEDHVCYTGNRQFLPWTSSTVQEDAPNLQLVVTLEPQSSTSERQ